MFLKRRESEPNRSSEQCSHEWVEVEPSKLERQQYRRYCDLCGKLVVDVRKFVCRKCGRWDLRYEFLDEEHRILSIVAHKPYGYPPDHYYITLCSKCYQDFVNFTTDLKSKLEENYRVIDFEPVNYETHFINNIDQLKDMLREIVYYGSPFKEDFGSKGNWDIYGLGAYLVLKHIGLTVKVIIPYNTIIEYMELKREMSKRAS